jgi:N-acyl-D-amino-acid deacylase
LKSVYGKGAVRGQEILQLLKEARKEGIQVTADVYPYTASYTGIGILFPDWAKPPYNYQEVRKNQRQVLDDYLYQRVMKRNGPEATLLGMEPYQGLTLQEAADKAGKPFTDLLIDDLGPDGGSGAYFIMDQELQDQFILDSLVMFCSDGSPTGNHPRGHGTFAKIIEDYVVQQQKMPIEYAVYKMTGYPARVLGLQHRGTIATGYAADLLVFDPIQVKATATYENPFQLADGFEEILVNGKRVKKDGAFTGERNGKMLRKINQNE